MANAQIINVGDWVWEDKDADGIQDAGEQGLAGVSVKLYSYNDATKKWDSTVQTTKTDATGKYGFTNLDPGTYKVLFALPTNYFFSPQAAVVSNKVNSDADVTTGYTTDFKLDFGESGDNSYVDAGMYRKCTVSSLVWDDVNADGIRDATEKMLSGVTVNLYTETGTTPVKSAVTDVNGKYSLIDIVPGKYRIQFVAKSGYAFSFKDATSDDKDSDVYSNGYTDVFSLDSGANLTNTSAGMYQPANLGDLVWHDVNANGLQEAGELGIKGITVELYQKGQTTKTASTMTDANGVYHFTELLPRTYNVKFITKDGYVISSKSVGGNRAIDSDPDPSSSTTADVTLIAGETNNNIDAGFYKYASIGDKVWYDRNGDGKQTGEAAAAGVTVKLYSGNTLLQTVSTAIDGTYKFSNVVPGSYNIKFDAPTSYVFTTMNVGNDDTIDSDADKSGWVYNVTVKSDEHITHVDAGLYDKGKVAALGDLLWNDRNLNGKQDGEVGIAKQIVTLYTAAGEYQAKTETDVNGNYLFTELVPGSYKVKFVLPDNTYRFSPINAAADDVDSDAANDGYTANYTLVESQVNKTADCGVYQPASVGDTVWEDNNGDGIINAGEAKLSGVAVHLYSSSGTLLKNTTTNSAGIYLFDNLAPGDYYVKFDAPTGYKFTKQTTGLASGSDADSTGKTPNFTLVPAQNNMDIDAGLYKPASVGDLVWHDLDGDGVQDAGEPGIPNLWVHLYTASGTWVADVPTNASGSYQFSNQAPGSYYIKFDKYPGASFTGKNATNSSSDSDANANGQTDVFTLTSGQNRTDIDAGQYLPVAIGNKVWNDSNANGVQNNGEGGIAGVTVHLYRNGVHAATTSTNGNGDYSFTNLKPGSFVVEFKKPNGTYQYSPANQTNDAIDSDANGSGVTGGYTLKSGDGTNNTVDCGMYQLGSISGQAWHDENENGIQNGGEWGVGSVEVRLYNSGGGWLATTYTDGGGNYKFSNLQAGTYRLFIPTNGYGQVSASAGGYWLVAKEDAGDDRYDSDFIMDKANDNSDKSWSQLYSKNKSGNYGWATSYTYLSAGENEKDWDVGLTPIIIDLNRDGVHTLARGADVNGFDLLGNGSVIKSGWVSAQDGLLAIDNNSDGKINNIHELFGGLQKGDGFAKLANFDSNGDGLVNGSDAEFANLKIWRDANSNHQTDEGELMSLVDVGVTSLSVSFIEVPELDDNGNLHLERSAATLDDGSVVDMTDVYFNVSAVEVAQAGVENLPSMAQLLSNNGCLDGLIGDCGPVYCSVPVDDANISTMATWRMLTNTFEQMGCCA